MKVLMSWISRGMLGDCLLLNWACWDLSSIASLGEDVVELNVRTTADLPASVVAKSWHRLHFLLLKDSLLLSPLQAHIQDGNSYGD